MNGQKFVIDSLPRTGSTTFARLLGCHPGVRCLIEPFHPKRYEGRFNQLATDCQAATTVLRCIFERWNGIKHVWEATGWPFLDRPAINDAIVTSVPVKVFFLRRRNLLRRVVSNVISRQLKFWIGSRLEFYARLNSVQLSAITSEEVCAQLARDDDAIRRRIKLFRSNGIQVLMLDYEDMFQSEKSGPERLRWLNSAFSFIEMPPIGEGVFLSQCKQLFDSSVHQWASPEVYRRVPGIERIEREVGSDATGWLFRG